MHNSLEEQGREASGWATGTALTLATAKETERRKRRGGLLSLHHGEAEWQQGKIFERKALKGIWPCCDAGRGLRSLQTLCLPCYVVCLFWRKCLGVLLQKRYGINMVQYNAPNSGCQSVGISHYCNVFTPQLSETKWPGMKRVLCQ